MKKYVFAAFAALLVLTGCSNQNAPEATDDQIAETVATGYYVSGSPVEQQTYGTVTQYDLPGKDYVYLSGIGDAILLASSGEETQLTVLAGERCVPNGQATISLDLLSGSFQETYSGLVYYDEAQREAVFLNTQLQETKRITLPEQLLGTPAFSANGGEIYYCIGQEIRGLDIDRGVSRLIKSHICQDQALVGSYFDGKMLACRTQNDAGQWNTVYVSTLTGETLGEDNKLEGLDTFEDRFFCRHMDGPVQQWIFGELDGEKTQLNTPEEMMASAVSLGGAVGYDVGTEGVLQLAFYDFSSGKKTAAIELTGIGEPVAFYGDRWSGCVWILTQPDGDGNQALLRWNIKLSAVEEETSYTGPLFTASSPDSEGIRACQSRVDALNKAHGITIRIWDNALVSPGPYTLVREHQVPAIEKTLDELEAALDRFPEKFLYRSVNRTIRICIVRSIDGQLGSVQYWYNRDAFVVISTGVDVWDALSKELGLIVDNHVLVTTSMYKEWAAMNPEGFAYGNSDTYSDAFLEGGTRAFFDKQSMTAPEEDRRAVFWQAMQPGNEELFQSGTMQEKLLLLCKAIRKSWRLEEKSDVYPWEQYLAESIAY